jgi:hypothetical protein
MGKTIMPRPIIPLGMDADEFLMRAIRTNPVEVQRLVAKELHKKVDHLIKNGANVRDIRVHRVRRRNLGK